MDMTGLGNMEMEPARVGVKWECEGLFVRKMLSDVAHALS